MIARHPGRIVGKGARQLAQRVRSVIQPRGINVVLLGPDGAGKSSVIAALEQHLYGAFDRSVCWGFAPPLHRLFRRGPKSTSEPHALPPRSQTVSLVRAAYWLAWSTCGYPVLRLALARSTLVLNDRHFVDILVDPKRYRYGSPEWVLRVLWRLMAKPDLVLLLDAQPAVLQARKQEVSFTETARQREAYLALLRTLSNGQVINADQPRSHVARDSADAILQQLTKRIVRRYRLAPGEWTSNPLAAVSQR
jgi:thymidylate kinase